MTAATTSIVAPEHDSAALTTPQTDVYYPWFPVSPCAEGCVGEDDAGVGRIRLTLRLIRVFLILATVAMCAFVVAPMPCLVRRRFIRRAARAILMTLGITIDYDDRRPFADNTRGLVVSNHISFLDVFAVATVNPAHFVAKVEVVTMPVVATIARRIGVIPIERASLHRLPETVNVAVDRLRRDATVAVFPEGTTRCGQSMGSFRPAFFQAAIDARVPVLPVRLAFTTCGGVTTAPSFIGDDTPLDTLRRVLRMQGLTVTVRMYEPQLPGDDRRELARRCERIIAGGEPERTDPEQTSPERTSPERTVVRDALEIIPGARK